MPAEWDTPGMDAYRRATLPVPERCDHCDRYCDGCQRWEPGYVARPWATLTDNWRKLETQSSESDPLDAARGIMNGLAASVILWALLAVFLFYAFRVTL